MNNRVRASARRRRRVALIASSRGMAATNGGIIKIASISAKPVAAPNLHAVSRRRCGVAPHRLQNM